MKDLIKKLETKSLYLFYLAPLFIIIDPSGRLYEIILTIFVACTKSYLALITDNSKKAEIVELGLIKKISENADKLQKQLINENSYLIDDTKVKDKKRNITIENHCLFWVFCGFFKIIEIIMLNQLMKITFNYYTFIKLILFAAVLSNNMINNYFIEKFYKISEKFKIYYYICLFEKKIIKVIKIIKSENHIYPID